ncbi:hypothetical protein VNO80_25608 [Phaseolus coccineus]|uniref:Uncharacterized protein n=1 Tax=Phaseolus coccineus TaxID=3886 RepID=A0AAN9LZN0_PHACN
MCSKGKPKQVHSCKQNRELQLHQIKARNKQILVPRLAVKVLLTTLGAAASSWDRYRCWGMRREYVLPAGVSESENREKWR